MDDNLIITPQNNDLPKLNVFQRIFSTIVSPEKLMIDLDQKPRVLLGIIITILAPMITMLGSFPMFKEYLRYTMDMATAKTGQQLTSEMLDQVTSAYSFITPITAGITSGVILLVQALVVWLVMKIFKGQARYRQILSVLGYTSVIAILGAIVSVIVNNVTGTYTDVTYSSLASFIPDLKGSLIFGIARVVDVFYIWQLVIGAIGIATVSKVDKKKAYLVMACIFVIVAAYCGYNEVITAKVLN